jgi:hypothetical protein
MRCLPFSAFFGFGANLSVEKKSCPIQCFWAHSDFQKCLAPLKNILQKGVDMHWTICAVTKFNSH